MITGATAARLAGREGTAARPLSAGQQGLFFLHKAAPESRAYNVACAAVLRADVDLALLDRAMRLAFDRHEAWRTRFLATGGGPVRVVEERGDFAIAREEATGWSREELSRHIRAEALRPFDLARESPWRALVFAREGASSILLLAAHHIAIDGWSFRVCLREIAAVYESLRNGQPAALPPPRAGYSDFVEWQQKMLAGPRGEAHWSFWREILKGDLPVLDLPADRPRPAVQGYEGALRSFAIPPDPCRRLADLARRRGTTLYTLLLAAFQILLHRLSNQETILIGSPAAGRSRPEFRDTAGYFVNSVVMRGDLGGDPAFLDFLQAMHRTVRSALVHQDYPFPLLLEKLGSPRDPSRSPLFQCAFVFQKRLDLAPLAALVDPDCRERPFDLDGLALGPLTVFQPEDQYDVAVEMAPFGDAIQGVLKYRADLFDAETMGELLGRYLCLLDDIAAHPEERVSRLRLLAAADEARLLENANGPHTDQPGALSLQQLFEQSARRNPRGAAVLFEGRALTYEGLNARANRLAHYLGSLGVGPETLVALALDRTPEAMVALLAVIKAGGAYLPLDPAYPAARLKLMLDGSGAALVLTRGGLKERLPPCAARIVDLDAEREQIAAASSENPACRTTPDSLLYVIYTSGSTGEPKGVAMPHRAIANLIAWQLENTAVQGPARTLQFASMSFDVSIQEIFTAWGSGSALVLAGEEIRRNMERLAHLIADQEVERLFVPFVALQHLAQALAAHDERKIKLREVITAGEQLKITPAIARLFARLPGCVLCNQYGPTESHVATAHVLPPDTAAWPALPPIGRPLANMEVHVLDAALRPVPAGVPGEIFIGGAGLARGYLNRPELTAERFVPHPFSESPNARLYRTGDLGRLRRDGAIEFLGRGDFQVKLRGHRIELGEIEAVLCGHAAVSAAAVVLHGEAMGRERLVAFIVSADKAAPSARELRDFAKERLPSYMVPAAFVPIDALPLTPNGKVDRRRLPAPDKIPAGPEEEFEPPRTPTEAVVAGIWAGVLGLERVGRNDNFFELGGHSLLATQVASRVRAATGVDAPLRDFFEAPTVQALAARCDAAGSGSGGGGSPIEKAPRAGAMPLSFAQERMWFLHQLDPEGAAYNMGVPFRLAGPLDRRAVQHSLREIVRRHENLRTTFRVENGRPVMHIAPEGDFRLRFVDLKALPASERLPEAQRLAGLAIREPFDLEAGPLLRVTIYRLAEEDHVILFGMHHIVSDLWTFGVLFDELSALYNAHRAGRPAGLPEPALQYADFAVWQRRWFRGEVQCSQLFYWRKQLDGVQVLDLPVDRPRAKMRTFDGAFRSLELSARAVAALKAFAAAEGATPFMILLAVFKLLLARITAQTDIVVGSPIANRHRLEVEEMTGTFVNTLPMRTDLGGDPTFRELVRRVRETTLGAYAHQDMPFEKLVEALQPERDMSRAPLVQVLFNLANVPFETPHIDDLAWSPIEVDRGAAQFELSLFVDLDITRKAYAEFNVDLFDAATIERWLGHFRTAFEAALADPDQRLSAIRLLDPAERKRLLVDWNRTEMPFSRFFSVAQLVEAQASRTPGALAVRCNGRALTYSELNRRADQAACRLRAAGARPGVIAGIFMERSVEMAIGLLGILKTGAAYLPLDPAFPKERLAFIAEDAAAQIVLTSRNLLGDVPASQAQIVVLDAEETAIEVCSRNDPAPAARPDDLAYVIYTSGSTGKPKGVQIPHRALVNFLESVRSEPGLAAGDTVLALTTLSFDIAALELWLPLITGAAVYMVDRETAYDATRLAREIASSGATVMQATPATWRMLIESGWQGGPHLKILCGGEALARDLANALLARSGSLFNMYGPTETTVWSAVWPVEAGDGPILIGRPIANTELYVLDQRLEPVPIGVSGELYIGGEGLARGYLHREELTREKFIRHPFRDDPGARIYKTGDLARFRADGRVECLGRLDNQVKIRGFRIELGEIEAALDAYPTIHKSVVAAHAEAAGDRRLVAYALPEREQQPTLAEVRPFLCATLPDYMIPSALVLVESFPLTPNGKIDRRALPAPEPGRPDQIREYAPPRSPLEKTLARIWSEVLGIEKVGINDDFFDLGGHSLLAARLADAVRRTLHIDLPLRSLFLESTVANLAAKITYAAETGSYAYHDTPSKWASLVPIQPKGIRRPFFLVSGTYREEGEFYGYMAHLVPHLGLDQPVFGFRARGLDGREKPHRSAEEMARDYIAEMRLYQPQGPYLLGGECVGGVVAFEMAQQLARDGQEVGLLLLLDTVRPSWQSQLWIRLDYLRRKRRSVAKNLRQILQTDRAKGRRHLAMLFNRKRRLYFPRNEDERIRKRIHRIEDAYVGLMFRYRPQPYRGRLTLIVNEEQYRRDPFIGWRGLAGNGFDIHRVPGNHLTRITEHVVETAAKLRACLDQAQGRAREGERGPS